MLVQILICNQPIEKFKKTSLQRYRDVSGETSLQLILIYKERLGSKTQKYRIFLFTFQCTHVYRCHSHIFLFYMYLVCKYLRRHFLSRLESFHTQFHWIFIKWYKLELYISGHLELNHFLRAKISSDFNFF